MSNRIIKSRARGSSIQLIDCLSSLLTLETFFSWEGTVSDLTLVEQCTTD